jgi:hypothetical protein
MEVFDGFLNQIAVAVAHVAEFRAGNAHIKHPLACVAVTRGLKPGIEGLAVHLLFQRGKDLNPRIQRSRRRDGERHAKSSITDVPGVEAATESGRRKYRNARG